jgi:long-chain acyl-CoA synthetase
VANLRALMAARQSEEPETVLSMLPPAHLYELVVGQLAPLVIGGRVVYAGALLPNRLVTAIRDHGITRALVVPALLDALCREVVAGLIDHALVRPACQQSSAVSIAMKLAQYPAEERERIRRAVRVQIGPTFRAFGLGGAAIGSGWPDTLGLLGIGLDVGYGLTEAGPLVSLGWASECPAGSVGRPLPGVMVRIDQRGEVLVRSDGTMRGYFADTDATAAALEDGWLHTGDRGLLDAGGYLYILGRLKEAMVTAAGDTLHPEEIEPYYNSRFFSEHCVVPLRGSDGNDLPALIIVPQRPDMSDDEIDRVFGELRAAAPPRYRIATMVRRNEPLPRTLLGKLKRRELGQTLELNRDSRMVSI